MSDKTTDQNAIDYGFQFVKALCDHHGPRISGTPEEKAAAEETFTELKKITDEQYLDHFPVFPTFYPGGFLKIAAICMLFGIPFLFLKGPWPLLALFFPLFGFFIIFVSLFGMRTWFAIGQKKGISYNATGRLLPKKNGKPVEGKAKVVIAGHLDSAFQMPITRFGDNVFKIAVPGLLYLILLMIFGLVKTLILAFGEPVVLWQNAWLMITWLDVMFIVFSFVGLPAFYILISGLIGGTPVMGANDNLSGVGLAMSIGKYFADPNHQLENVEVWIGGFGSEECGERGAEAFVKKYGDQGLLDNAQAVIPDSAGGGERLAIICHEKMHFAKHDIGVCNRLLQAYHKWVKEDEIANPISIEGPKPLPFAASDAGRFSLKGYKAVFLGAFAGKLMKPKAWHAEDDTWENLDLPIYGASYHLIKHFILLLEEELKSTSSK